MINWRSAPCNGRTHFPTTANPNRCNALTRTNTDNKQASDWALDDVDGTNHFTMLKVNSFFGADIETIDAHLSLDPLLAPFVAQGPGLRAPGGWDGFELGVRAILGQQVTVAAARLLAGQLVASHGERVSSDFVIDPRLTHVFPEAHRIALAESIDVGMPAARRSALKELAAAAVADPNLFRSFGTIEEAIARFRKIRGVGEWTAQYIALRALRETDAFPAADIGLLRGAEVVDGTRSTVPNLLLRSESWRPWRLRSTAPLGRRYSHYIRVQEHLMSNVLHLLIDRIETPIGELLLVAATRRAQALQQLPRVNDALA